LAVLDYHYGDTFQNSDGTGRISYYGISGYPTAKIDGSRTYVGGSSATFSGYLSNYNYEMQFSPSRCTLNVFVDYNSTTRVLKVKARATKVDTFQNARLRYAIAENRIPKDDPGWPYPFLFHVVRKMLPNYTGVLIPNALSVGQSFVDSQTYTLPSGWNHANCYVVVFAQDDDSPKPVFRSAKSGLFLTWVYGDASGDGIVNAADASYLLNYLFVNGPPPSPLASGDPNGDCIINASDVIYLINYLFVGGPPSLKGCAW
jgi:hypothetical protein